MGSLRGLRLVNLFDVVHVETIKKPFNSSDSAKSNFCLLTLVAIGATNRSMSKKSAITQYREDHDRMSLEEFGRLFEPAVDKSTVLRWERGHITPKRAIEVESVTGIPRAAILPEIFVIPEAAE